MSDIPDELIDEAQNLRLAWGECDCLDCLDVLARALMARDQRAAHIVQRHSISYNSLGQNTLRPRLDGDRQGLEYATAILTYEPKP